MREAREILRRQPDVVAAWLHGSAVSEDAAGDLDVAVLFDSPEVLPARLTGLAHELATRGAPSGPDVDLRPLARTAPRFRVNVLRRGLLLYERSARERIEFEARSMSEWLDFRPTWDRMRKRMRDRWSGE